MAGAEQLIRTDRPDGIIHLQVDFSSVFEDPEAFAEACEYMYQMYEREVFDVIVAVDSVGCIFASQVAKRMGKPLAILGHRSSMLRDSVSERYETRHGDRYLYLPSGSVTKGQKVVIIGEYLTHGKDVLAAVNLIRSQGAVVSKIGMFVEHSDFNARRKYLRGIPLECMFFTADL